MRLHKKFSDKENRTTPVHSVDRSKNSGHKNYRSWWELDKSEHELRNGIMQVEKLNDKEQDTYASSVFNIKTSNSRWGKIHPPSSWYQIARQIILNSNEKKNSYSSTKTANSFLGSEFGFRVWREHGY